MEVIYVADLTGIAKVVADMRIYWREHEEILYDTGINPTTNKYYMTEARRDFTKYHLQDIARFYIMRDKIHNQRGD